MEGEILNFKPVRVFGVGKLKLNFQSAADWTWNELLIRLGGLKQKPDPFFTLLYKIIYSSPKKYALPNLQFQVGRQDSNVIRFWLHYHACSAKCPNVVE